MSSLFVARVERQRDPAAGEMLGGGVAELRAKCFERAEVLRRAQSPSSPRGSRAGAGVSEFQKKIVIEMAATVVLHGGANFRGQLVGVAQQFRERELLQLRCRPTIASLSFFT